MYSTYCYITVPAKNTGGKFMEKILILDLLCELRVMLGFLC